MSETLQMFNLSSKDIDIMIPAKDRQESFAKFFLMVKKGEISIDDLGCLVVSREGEDEGDDVPFRTVPTLWLLELISPATAFNILEQMLDLDPDTDEAANLLLSSANQDMWILDKIEEIEASSNCAALRREE